MVRLQQLGELDRDEFRTEGRPRFAQGVYDDDVLVVVVMPDGERHAVR